MNKYKINGQRLTDWNTFHSEFKKELNFPNYYWENLDAWIDCVDDLADQPVVLEIQNCRTLKENAPKLLEAIFECTALINHRKIEGGKKPTLKVSIDL